jgi:hypothetical protein
VPPVLLVFPELLDYRVLQVFRGVQVFKEVQEQQASKVLPAPLAQLELQVFLALPDYKVLLD